ncbi:hypothetical protein ACWD4G_02705 [Streptomyces sp. NPDC002643]
MGYDPRGRSGTPSIHQSALDNLRRGYKPVLLFLAVVFGLMALFVGGGMLFTWRSMPVVPTGVEDGTGTASSPAPGSSSSAASDAWRASLVAFLTDAVRGEGARWFPGSSAESDGLTYTPLSPDAPGSDRPDGLARVLYHDLSKAEEEIVLAAVTRDGTVRPDSLKVTESSGTDSAWTLRFTVTADDADVPLKGEAEGYTTSSGAPVILRLVYREAAATPAD